VSESEIESSRYIHSCGNAHFCLEGMCMIRVCGRTSRMMQARGPYNAFRTCSMSIAGAGAADEDDWYDSDKWESFRKSGAHIYQYMLYYILYSIYYQRIFSRILNVFYDYCSPLRKSRCARQSSLVYMCPHTSVCAPTYVSASYGHGGPAYKLDALVRQGPSLPAGAQAAGHICVHVLLCALLYMCVRILEYKSGARETGPQWPADVETRMLTYAGVC
jgi:hypothetical protein